MDIPLSTFGNCQRHWKKLYKGLIYVEQSPNKKKNYVAFLIRGLTIRAHPVLICFSTNKRPTSNFIIFIYLYPEFSVFVQCSSWNMEQLWHCCDHSIFSGASCHNPNTPTYWVYDDDPITRFRMKRTSCDCCNLRLSFSM